MLWGTTKLRTQAPPQSISQGALVLWLKSWLFCFSSWNTHLSNSALNTSKFHIHYSGCKEVGTWRSSKEKNFCGQPCLRAHREGGVAPHRWQWPSFYPGHHTSKIQVERETSPWCHQTGGTDDVWRGSRSGQNEAKGRETTPWRMVRESTTTFQTSHTPMGLPCRPYTLETWASSQKWNPKTHMEVCCCFTFPACLLRITLLQKGLHRKHLHTCFNSLKLIWMLYPLLCCSPQHREGEREKKHTWRHKKEERQTERHTETQ